MGQQPARRHAEKTGGKRAALHSGRRHHCDQIGRSWLKWCAKPLVSKAKFNGTATGPTARRENWWKTRCASLRKATPLRSDRKELGEMVREAVGFKGEIQWDSNRPDGTPRKLVENALRFTPEGDTIAIRSEGAG